MGNRSQVSLALVEEVELISAVLQQVFQHADYWQQADSQTFCQLKDYTLFALAKLLQHCDSKAIMPASTTEEHLKKITASVLDDRQANLLVGNAAAAGGSDPQMSAFELKVEISLQKSFLNMTSSVLSCILLSQQMVREGKLQGGCGEPDLVVTWEQDQAGLRAHHFTHRAPSQASMHQPSGPSTHFVRGITPGIFSEEWLSSMQAHGVSIVQVAAETMRACQDRMLGRLGQLRSLASDSKFRDLFKYLRDIFLRDEWVRKEYTGGFNAYSLADVERMEDVIEVGSTALQVSAQVSAHLLAKVRDHPSCPRDLRGSYYGYDATTANEQQVVFLSNDALVFSRESERECSYARD